jgi:hypothetical protein
MNAALIFPLAVLVLAAAAIVAGYIGYGAGVDHAHAQAEAEAQARAEHVGQAADVESWYTEHPWRVPDQLGTVLPEGAPCAPRVLPWPVGPRGHNVPELAHIWAPPPERPDAEKSRPVTSPADLDLSVRRMCDETARYVQQLIDQHPETP